MARVHFPSLVDGDECVSETAQGTLHNGVGGFEPDFYVKKSLGGDRWGPLGKLMMAAMAPSLKPQRRK